MMPTKMLTNNNMQTVRCLLSIGIGVISSNGSRTKIFAPRVSTSSRVQQVCAVDTARIRACILRSQRVLEHTGPGAELIRSTGREREKRAEEGAI